MAGEIIAGVVSGILICAGIVGIFLPIVPGVFLAWAGLALFAFTTGFAAISWVVVAVFFGLTALSAVLDAVLPALNARRFGAGKLAVLGAVVGTLIGVIFLGPLGIFVGPLAGAVLGELLSGRDIRDALRAGAGVTLGIIASSILKLVLALAMAGFFVATLF